MERDQKIDTFMKDSQQFIPNEKIKEIISSCKSISELQN